MDDLKIFLRKREKLTSLIILFLILVSLPIGVYMIQRQQIFKSKASTSDTPFEIIQNTATPQKAICYEQYCVIKSLDIIIKPNIGLENIKEPVKAIVR